MKRLHTCLGALTLGIGLAFSPLAQATLVLDDGTVFYGFVSGSGSNYTLVLRMDFSATKDSSQFLGDRIEAWSLQLPEAATSTLVDTSAHDAADWTVYNSGKAVGGNNGCSNGKVPTICVDRVDNSSLHGTGPEVTKTYFDWMLEIDFAVPQTFTGAGNFHLLTVRLDDKAGWKKDGELISLDLGTFLTCVPGTPDCGPPDEGGSVPEPGSLALLGLGALIAGGLRRRPGRSG